MGSVGCRKVNFVERQGASSQILADPRVSAIFCACAALFRSRSAKPWPRCGIQGSLIEGSVGSIDFQTRDVTRLPGGGGVGVCVMLEIR